MKEDQKNYIGQYKLLFYLSWIILYFIFPSWRFYHIYISFTDELIRLPFPSEIVLLTYFFAAAYVLSFCFKSLVVDGPPIAPSNNLTKYIKNNLWLFVVCSIAVVLHALTYLPVYAPTIKYSLWIYNFITYHWHRLFHFPVRYPLWLFLFILMLVIKQKKLSAFISSCLNAACALYRSNFFTKLLFMVTLAGIFLAYTRLLPNYSGQDHYVYVAGYPPLGTFLYMVVHLLFGIKYPYLGPSLIQLSFYIAGSVFLYRTIHLFCEKETALLGSSIYLFLPIVFTYAGLGHLASGVVFFIIIISYFCLKFTRDGRSRDLILATYFISIGYLYKHDILVMFFICSAYLVFNKLRQNNFRLISSLKILSLSFLSIIPWYFIGAGAASKTDLSHVTALDSSSSYLLMLMSQMSLPVFILFLLSIIYVFSTDRKPLPLFFGLIFISYYFLYTMVQQQSVHRYSMALYPAISVFLALFIYDISQKVRWRHAFKIVSTVMIIYLAVLCIIPRSSTKLITFKYTDFEIQSFPADEAVEWLLNNTGKDEKVLKVFFGGDATPLRRAKAVPDDKFVNLGLIKNLENVNQMFASGDLGSFRQYLKELCKKEKVSYIIFPGGKAFTMYPNKKYREMEIRKFFEEDKYDDFIVAAKFNIDDNYIYIYKLRDGFIEKQ